jgi:hypothetical protein
MIKIGKLNIVLFGLFSFLFLGLLVRYSLVQSNLSSTSLKPYVFMNRSLLVLADTATPTPSSTPASANIANCDSCGFCQDTAKLLKEIWENDKKSETTIVKEWHRWVASWKKCRDCLYLDFSSMPLDPYENAISPTPPLVDEYYTLKGLPTPDPESYYTMIGCISTNPGKFTKQITDFFFRIVGAIAFLFLLYGAGVVATSQSDPEKLNHGKRIIYGAIVGLIFVLLSTFIFNFIAANILKIPGFGG